MIDEKALTRLIPDDDYAHAMLRQVFIECEHEYTIICTKCGEISCEN